MGLKLSTSPRAITTEQYRDIVQDAVEINTAVEAMGTLSAEMNELETIQANVELCMHALNTANSTEMLKVIDAQESVAALCGVAESKLTKEAAMEGLGESVKNFFKNMWKKIRGFFAKVCDVFRRIFSNAEGELKHLEKIVAAENDKNFDASKQVSIPLPTKAAVDAIIHSMGVLNGAAAKMIPFMVQVVGSSEIKTAFQKIADSGMDMRKKESNEKVDGVVMTTELKKFMGAKGKEFEDVAKELDNAVKTDPILKELINTSERLVKLSGKNPMEVLKIVNANFVKTGTVADLGWKTGADMRSTVTAFTSMWRSTRSAVHSYDQLLGEMQKLDPIIEKIATNSGVPKDFIGVIRLGVQWLRTILAAFAKNEHTSLIGITRVVRACYK